jgi:hypothetical protein
LLGASAADNGSGIGAAMKILATSTGRGFEVIVFLLYNTTRPALGRRH